jgi:cytochrome P450
MVSDRPSGELFIDLAKKYPGEDLINLTATRGHVLVANPKLFADLLVHKAYDFAKPSKISNFLRHVLGEGLIIVEGDKHKFLRKNTMPAFHFRHIKELYPMMMGKANLMANARKEDMKADPAGEKDAGVVELSSWASKVTIDIIGIAGLGRKFDVVEKRQDPLGEIYEALLEPSREKLIFSMLSLALGFEFVQHIPWKMNDTFKHLTTSLDDICRPMIKEKREAIEEKGDDHFDVLSLLIKSDNFTDTELKDQLLTFLAAG